MRMTGTSEVGWIEDRRKVRNPACVGGGGCGGGDADDGGVGSIGRGYSSNGGDGRNCRRGSHFDYCCWCGLDDYEIACEKDGYCQNEVEPYRVARVAGGLFFGCWLAGPERSTSAADAAMTWWLSYVCTCKVDRYLTLKVVKVLLR